MGFNLNLYHDNDDDGGERVGDREVEKECVLARGSEREMQRKNQ